MASERGLVQITGLPPQPDEPPKWSSIPPLVLQPSPSPTLAPARFGCSLLDQTGGESQDVVQVLELRDHPGFWPSSHATVFASAEVSSIPASLERSPTPGAHAVPVGYHGSPGFKKLKADVFDRFWASQYAAELDRDKDGESMPPAILAAVVLAFTSRGELVVTQRLPAGEEQLYPNLWVCPGGHVDPAETIEACAVREFHEETGLEVDSETLEYVAIYESLLFRRRRQYTIVFFAATLKSEYDDVDAILKAAKPQVSEIGMMGLVAKDQLPAVAAWNTPELEAEVGANPFPGIRRQGKGSTEWQPCEFKLSQLLNELDETQEHPEELGNAHRYALQQYLQSKSS